MNIKKILIFVLAANLTACNLESNTPSTSVDINSTAQQQYLAYTPAVSSILTTDLNTLWSQDFDHYQKGSLLAVSQGISALSKQGDLSNPSLEKLSYYLRIYSSFGPDKDWLPGTAEALNQALTDLQAMPGFYQVTPTTAKLHENYAVALYRLYFLAPLRLHSVDHLQPLTKLINLYASTDIQGNNTQVDYTLWEILRASAILPYEAVRKNKTEHLAIYGANESLPDALLAFIESKNAVINQDDWPRQHAVWALSQYYNIYDKQYENAYFDKDEAEQKQLDKGELKLPMQRKMTVLDNKVWQVLSHSLADNSAPLENDSLLKNLFSIPYVVSTFRGKSACEEGSLKGRCISPTIEEATPVSYTCSESLYIRTQNMTQAQLKDACATLIAQTRTFHEKLATHNRPVANDFNDKLRVIVFHDASEYNKYGQLTFDINTNNGGMYIEGSPQDPKNIATFYSYEQFWARPEFKVWNLNHEYVHYLDGRFNKYDGFNHFPSHLVWWSEGLAEYISKGNTNQKAFKKLHETPKDEWLSLQQVFDTKYRDGTDQVYKWGYLAVRFMYEKHPQTYLQMAHFLKTDFFDGYKNLLDDSGKQYQAEFSAWLEAHDQQFVDVTMVNNPHKPRQLYRYTYKTYLQPSNLVETLRHRHWQYWHENALKK